MAYTKWARRDPHIHHIEAADASNCCRIPYKGTWREHHHCGDSKRLDDSGESLLYYYYYYYYYWWKLLAAWGLREALLCSNTPTILLRAGAHKGFRPLYCLMAAFHCSTLPGAALGLRGVRQPSPHRRGDSRTGGVAWGSFALLLRDLVSMFDLRAAWPQLDKRPGQAS